MTAMTEKKRTESDARQSETEFRWPVRVYIEDTDAGGIVYYVNYLKYMERARTELLRDIGFGKAAILDSERMFVVRSVAVDYRAPARLDDELIIQSRVLAVRGAGLSMQQDVLRNTGADPVLLCGGRVELACVDRSSLRPCRVPKPLLEALMASTGPI